MYVSIEIIQQYGINTENISFALVIFVFSSTLFCTQYNEANAQRERVLPKFSPKEQEKLGIERSKFNGIWLHVVICFNVFKDNTAIFIATYMTEYRDF